MVQTGLLREHLFWVALRSHLTVTRAQLVCSQLFKGLLKGLAFFRTFLFDCLTGILFQLSITRMLVVSHLFLAEFCAPYTYLPDVSALQGWAALAPAV
jgi:hypothetical protein